MTIWPLGEACPIAPLNTPKLFLPDHCEKLPQIVTAPLLIVRVSSENAVRKQLSYLSDTCTLHDGTTYGSPYNSSRQQV